MLSLRGLLALNCRHHLSLQCPGYLAGYRSRLSQARNPWIEDTLRTSRFYVFQQLLGNKGGEEEGYSRCCKNCECVKYSRTQKEKKHKFTAAICAQARQTCTNYQSPLYLSSCPKSHTSPGNCVQHLLLVHQMRQACLWVPSERQWGLLRSGQPNSPLTLAPHPLHQHTSEAHPPPAHIPKSI